MFGSATNAYTVDLQIKDTSSNSAVVSKTGTFHSGRLSCKDPCYYGFDVLFDSATELKKNTKYLVVALLISGPRSVHVRLKNCTAVWCDIYIFK